MLEILNSIEYFTKTIVILTFISVRTPFRMSVRVLLSLDLEPVDLLSELTAEDLDICRIFFLLLAGALTA